MSSSRSRLQSERTVAPSGGCEAPVSAASAMIRGRAASPGSAAKAISAAAWSTPAPSSTSVWPLRSISRPRPGATSAERERVGGRRAAAGRERAGDLVRAQDEDEADRAHRQAPDQRRDERRHGARAAQRGDEAETRCGGDGHRCHQRRPDRAGRTKRFGHFRIRDTGSVIGYRFGREDLLHTRFAISPLFELQASVAALRDPGAHSVHLPWVRAARERLAGFDYAMLDALRPRPRLRARLLRAAAALAAARRRRGARARARDRPRAGAPRARLALRRRRPRRRAAAASTTSPAASTCSST